MGDKPPFIISKSSKSPDPIIIDYLGYKITILMSKHRGVTVKFFYCESSRWFKLKDVTYNYYALESCINWAKSYIDNNKDSYLKQKLQTLIKSK